MAPQTSDVTRAQGAMSVAAVDVAADEVVLAEQAVALRNMTADIKRKSAIKGAAKGAVAGCGLSFVAGNGKSQCVNAAVAGGVIGGVAGFQAGDKVIEKRMQMIDVNRVLPSLKQASDSAEVVVRDVPSVLAAQDQELSALARQLEAGQITQADYDTAKADIRARRAALAEVLSLSAQQAAEARALFEHAQNEGQTALAWYVHAIRLIEQDATSARAQINLL
jgi:uncharacterized protein YcfJ